MNGGNLPEDFWQRLDERFDRLTEKIDASNAAINKIQAYGCAQRPNDEFRIQRLEAWKEGTTSKFIAMLLSIIGTLCMAIYSVFK